MSNKGCYQQLSVNAVAQKTQNESIPTESQEQQYSFSKDKLPKTLSYPLKRSLLDAALRQSSVYETVWFVRYISRQYGDTVISAHFSPEQYSYAASGKVWMDVWAVPPSERKSVEGMLLSQGLPLLCAWLANLATAGDAWRSLGHSFSLRRCGGELRCEER